MASNIIVIPSADPRLRRVVEHDPRSKQYPYARKATQIVSKRWNREVPTFNQGQVGSCTGNASTGLLGTDPYYTDLVKAVLAKLGVTLDESFAVKTYSAATAIDDVPGTYPPEDTGSSGLAVAKVLTSDGLISGYTHVFNFNDLLDALQHHPVITGTNWYEGMFNPDANGIIRISGQVAGGHEYIIDEVDVERQLLGIQNSWGDEWGVKGRAYITFTDFQRLMNEDGDITAFVPLSEPAPQPVPPAPQPADVDASLWAKIKDWAYARHCGKNKIAANEVLDWAKQKGYTS